MGQETVLIVEDDPEVVEIVSRQLADLGYGFEQAGDGRSGLAMALENDYALVVLDLGLPELGGLEVCRRLRAQRQLLPILILTGEVGETKTVLGLELGADEYIQKPVEAMVFRARVRALMRRAEAGARQVQDPASDVSSSSSSEHYAVGDLEVDAGLRRVAVAGQSVDLTSTELDILLLLVRNPNKVFSREAIVEAVWGYSNYSNEQNLRTHISRLRVKLDAVGKCSPYIVTQRGHGYRIGTESDQS